MTLPMSSDDAKLLNEFLGANSDSFAAPSSEFVLQQDFNRLYVVLIGLLLVAFSFLIVAWRLYADDVRTALSTAQTVVPRLGMRPKTD